mgnify:CR=1 FL=1
MQSADKGWQKVERKVTEDPRYHNTWKLLKKYRDVVWSLELSVQQVSRTCATFRTMCSTCDFETLMSWSETQTLGSSERKVTEDPRYHNTWKLLKKYRDVVWSLELSVQQVTFRRR